MNMIEKMARKLCALNNDGGEDFDSNGYDEGHDDYIPEWKFYIEDAKAALECLKEPTEGMLDARLYGLNHDVEYEQRKDLRPAIFKAMINAALEGK